MEAQRAAEEPNMVLILGVTIPLCAALFVFVYLVRFKSHKLRCLRCLRWCSHAHDEVLRLEHRLKHAHLNPFHHAHVEKLQEGVHSVPHDVLRDMGIGHGESEDAWSSAQ